MFDIGWSEILLIAAAAIIVVGPKDLPGLLRSVGQMVRKVRSISGEFKSQLNEALEADEIRKLKDDMNDIKLDNPMTEIKDSFESQFNGDFDAYISDDNDKPKKQDKQVSSDKTESDGEKRPPEPVAVTAGQEVPPAQVVNGAIEDRKTQEA